MQTFESLKMSTIMTSGQFNTSIQQILAMWMFNAQMLCKHVLQDKPATRQEQHGHSPLLLGEVLMACATFTPSAPRAA